MGPPHAVSAGALFKQSYALSFQARAVRGGVPNLYRRLSVNRWSSECATEPDIVASYDGTTVDVGMLAIKDRLGQRTADRDGHQRRKRAEHS